MAGGKRRGRRGRRSGLGAAEAGLSGLLALLLPRVALCHSLFGGSDVVEYAPATFEATVLEDPRVWVVVYYADWCGHCQHYAPVFKRMAEGLLMEQKRLRLGSLNCAAHSSFCSKIEVHSYPTVRSYHIAGDNESWTSKGGSVPWEVFHSAEKLPPWVLERLPPASSNGTAAPAPPAAAPPSAKSAPSTPAASASPADSVGAAGTGRPGAQQPAAATPAPAPAEPSALPAEGGARDAPGTAALRLVDAEVALLYSLRQGTFLAAMSSPERSPRLQGTALAELHAWLEFLASVLPTRQACDDVRALATVVAEAQDSPTNALLEDTWNRALDVKGLDGVPPQAGRDPAAYWRLCRTYTCGLWTLFHMLTIAAAEDGRASARTFLASGNGGLPAPQQALARLRGFTAHFFGCQECSSNFVQTFDSCGLGRCDLDPKDGEGAALWLVKVHNEVTKRVAVEGKKAELVVAWPPRVECAECWLPEGEDHWDSKAVYAFLKASYWEPDWTPIGHSSTSSPPDFMLAGGLLALAALGYILWHFLSHGALQRREKGS